MLFYHLMMLLNKIRIFIVNNFSSHQLFPTFTNGFKCHFALFLRARTLLIVVAWCISLRLDVHTAFCRYVRVQQRRRLLNSCRIILG